MKQNEQNESSKLIKGSQDPHKYVICEASSKLQTNFNIFSFLRTSAKFHIYLFILTYHFSSFIYHVSCLCRAILNVSFSHKLHGFVAKLKNYAFQILKRSLHYWLSLYNNASTLPEINLKKHLLNRLRNNDFWFLLLTRKSGMSKWDEVWLTCEQISFP